MEKYGLTAMRNGKGSATPVKFLTHIGAFSRGRRHRKANPAYLPDFRTLRTGVHPGVAFARDGYYALTGALMWLIMTTISPLSGMQPHRLEGCGKSSLSKGCLSRSKASMDAFGFTKSDATSVLRPSYVHERRVEPSARELKIHN